MRTKHKIALYSFTTIAIIGALLVYYDFWIQQKYLKIKSSQEMAVFERNFEKSESYNDKMNQMIRDP